MPPLPTPTAPQTVPPATPTARPLVVRAARDPRRERIPVRRTFAAPLEATFPAIDDLTRDFGPQIYQDMQHDPQVRAALQLPLRAVLIQPWQILPAVDGRVAHVEDPDFPQADRVARFHGRMLARLTAPPLPVTLAELGQALAEGHRVGELVWDVATLDPADGPQQIITAIKPKPNSVVAFVVDPFNNCYGVRYATLGGSFVTGPLVLASDGTIPDFLERDHCIIATWDPANGDPRGQSLLRAAYWGWWFRQQTWPEYLAWMAQFARPSVKGHLAKDADAIRTYDAAGNVLTETDPLDWLLAELEKIRGGGAIALPFEWDAEFLQVLGEGAPFLNALDAGARDIWMGVTGQTRANLEAQHGSRADSESGQDQLDLHEAWIATWVETLIRTDLLAPATVRNYGPDALRFLPLVSLGDTAPQDVAGRTTAAASAGYTLHWSQFPGIDSALGWPQRDMEAMAADRDAMAQVRQGQSPDGQQEDQGDLPGHGAPADQPPGKKPPANQPPPPKKGAPQPNG